MKSRKRNAMRLLALACALTPVTSVMAAAAPSQTALWLEMQRSGAQASRSAQPATEIERDKAVERFLKTYDYAIPASFYGNKFGVGK